MTCREKRAVMQESTENRERAAVDESTELQERAEGIESTEDPERAAAPESTEAPERAEGWESTDDVERAAVHESTGIGERAGELESTEAAERAEIDESTERRERCSPEERFWKRRYTEQHRTVHAMEDEIARLRAALVTAADDLQRAANQFERLTRGGLNAGRFAGKAARARVAVGDGFERQPRKVGSQ